MARPALRAILLRAVSYCRKDSLTLCFQRITASTGSGLHGTCIAPSVIEYVNPPRLRQTTTDENIRSRRNGSDRPAPDSAAGGRGQRRDSSCPNEGKSE